MDAAGVVRGQHAELQGRTAANSKTGSASSSKYRRSASWTLETRMTMSTSRRRLLPRSRWASMWLASGIPFALNAHRENALLLPDEGRGSLAFATHPRAGHLERSIGEGCREAQRKGYQARGERRSAARSSRSEPASGGCGGAHSPKWIADCVVAKSVWTAPLISAA